MGIVRIHYHPDGTVEVTRDYGINPPDSGMTDEEYKKNKFDIHSSKIPRFQELEYDDVDESQIPDKKYRAKWRGSKGNGVYIDDTVVTEAEKRLVIEQQLDAELAKPIPTLTDITNALKLQRKLDTRNYD